MITLNHMTREVACILEAQLKLEFKPTDSTECEKSQTHADVCLSNLELSQTLDNLSERILVPLANALLGRLVRGNAKYTYELNLSRCFDCCRVSYNGVSIRGMMLEKHRIWDDEGNELFTNLIRFDILWSS